MLDELAKHVSDSAKSIENAGNVVASSGEKAAAAARQWRDYWDAAAGDAKTTAPCAPAGRGPRVPLRPLVPQGDFAWATRVASAVGRGFGYLLIIAGIFIIFFAGLLTGAWLAFIGWFLVLAATAEGDAGIPSRTQASGPAP